MTNVQALEDRFRAVLGNGRLFRAFYNHLPTFDISYLKTSAAIAGPAMLIVVAKHASTIYSIFRFKTHRA